MAGPARRCRTTITARPRTVRQLSANASQPTGEVTSPWANVDRVVTSSQYRPRLGNSLITAELRKRTCPEPSGHRRGPTAQSVHHATMSVGSRYPSGTSALPNVSAGSPPTRRATNTDTIPITKRRRDQTVALGGGEQLSLVVLDIARRGEYRRDRHGWLLQSLRRHVPPVRPSLPFTVHSGKRPIYPVQPATVGGVEIPRHPTDRSAEAVSQRKPGQVWRSPRIR